MHTFASSYYKKANGIMLLYDCTDLQTKKNVKNWVRQIDDYVDKDSIVTVLICNKIDLDVERVVSTEEGQQLASDYGLKYFETSAKTGQNIDEIFKYIAQGV